jgi:hypothetical protein
MPWPMPRFEPVTTTSFEDMVRKCCVISMYLFVVHCVRQSEAGDDVKWYTSVVMS